jgi:hypothetical protein
MIVLSNTVGKIFARILANRLQAGAERDKWLPETQSSF